MLVAKKKSLFDDRPMEIQELTYIIKQVQCTQVLYNIIFISISLQSLLSVAILQCTFSYLRFCVVLRIHVQWNSNKLHVTPTCVIITKAVTLGTLYQISTAVKPLIV